MQHEAVQSTKQYRARGRSSAHLCCAPHQSQEDRMEQIQSRFEEKIARSSELRHAHLANIVQVSK